MNEPPVVVDREGAVAWVRLNRPGKLNAMNRALLESLLEALEEAAGDKEIGAVVVTGNGRAFCCGGDLRSSLTEITGEGPIARQTSELRRFMRVSQLLAEMDKPTVVAVNGACAGGGLGVACAADIRIASSDAVFATGFLNVGVPGDFAHTWGLSRAVGPGLARELCLTGRRLDADAARALGLVSFVVPPAELEAEATKLATELAARAPEAVAAIKKNFNSLPASLAQVLEFEAARHVTCTNSSNAEEARAAFLEKRKPNFQNRRG